VRQIKNPAVRVRVALLDTGQRPGGQESEQRRRVQRRPVGEPQIDRPGAGLLGRPAIPQGARRLRVHLENGVVELPHAAETRRERDLRQTQVGGLDQDPGGLRALRPGQRQRTGAQFGGEHPVQVALGVAELAGQAGHAVPVHHAVADQAHRPAHHIGPDVPFGRSRRGVRPAPAAGPEPATLGGGRAGIEGDVLRFRRAGRAGRPAVDTGGPHSRVEPAVEPLVTAVHRPVAPLEIQLHAVESAPSGTAIAGGFRTWPWLSTSVDDRSSVNYG
jgi:hypothetical protein